MGNCAFLSLAFNVRVIASANSWLEGDALEQLKTTAKLPKMLQAAGLPDLHSGCGYPIGADHQGIAIAKPAFAHYLAQHDLAVNWAKLNRYLIAQRFLAALGSAGDCVLDVTHNFVERLNENSFLHRKGCTPMNQGLVVIPGSRGDYSYLVKLRLENGEQSLFSLAHGAGRKWQRGECLARLKEKFHKTQLSRTALGSRVLCENKALLYEEAPKAYKNCASVIQDLLNAKLIHLVAKLQSVLTFKTLRN